MEKMMTDGEFAVLGLIVEKPSHGYDLERVIDDRGMRNWTELAFSSIYYVLRKLEDRGLVVSATETRSSQKARKTYSATPLGRQEHREKTLHALAHPRPVYPSILLGLANWPAVDRVAAMAALSSRRMTIQAQMAELSANAGLQSPLPDFVEALFDYSLSQMRAEIDWLDRTITTFGADHDKD